MNMLKIQKHAVLKKTSGQLRASQFHVMLVIAMLFIGMGALHAADAVAKAQAKVDAAAQVYAEYNAALAVANQELAEAERLFNEAPVTDAAAVRAARLKMEAARKKQKKAKAAFADADEELQKAKTRLEDEQKALIQKVEKAREKELKEKRAAEEKAAKAEAEARAKAEAEAKKAAEKQAKAEAEAKAKQLKAEAEAKKAAEKQAKAQAEAQAKAEAEAKKAAEKQAKAQAEAQAKAEAEAKKQAEAQAKAEAEAKKAAEKQAKAQAEAQAKAEAEAKKAAEKQAKAQAEAQAKAEAEAKKAAEKQAKAEAEAQKTAAKKEEARRQAELKAEKEASEKAQAAAAELAAIIDLSEKIDAEKAAVAQINDSIKTLDVELAAAIKDKDQAAANVTALKAAVKAAQSKEEKAQRNQELAAAEALLDVNEKTLKNLKKQKDVLQSKLDDSAKESQKLEKKLAKLKGDGSKAVEAAPAPVVAAAPAEEVKTAETAKPAPARRSSKIVEVDDEEADEKVAEEGQPVRWVPKPARQLPVLRGDQPLTVPEARKASIAPEGTKMQFDLPMVSGDKDIVEKLQVWKDWAEYVTFNPVTADDINEFHGLLVKALQEEGYVFANVQFPTRIWDYGIFLAKVDCGPLGDITVTGNKHYSREQIIRSLRNNENRFNYAKIHDDLFDLNARPDLTINAELKPITQGGRRVINADIEVDDKLPIHAAIEITNNGSKSTSDWRMRTTLQHMNLTKHEDILTFDWLTGAEVKEIGEDLNSLSASYFLPINDLWSFNVYGGWNNSDIDDVLPEIGVQGRGWYIGTQLTRVLDETPRYRTQITLGWLYQVWENHQDVAGKTFDKRSITFSMPSVTLGYVSKVFDRWHGRNVASLSLQHSKAGTFGASDRSDFNSEGAAFSDGDFLLAKLQLARFQRLFDGEDHPGKWTLYMKTDAQIATDDLPPSMREYVGGYNSVRGYEESEIGGDSSVTGTIELRTPLLENFIPGLEKDEEYLADNPKYWGRHRLQFLAFTDAGYVANKSKVPGEVNNQSLFSVGVGLRLGLTKFSQMSADYGLPLVEASDDTPDAGRLHISLQLQF